jgi:delta24-sterol reductase
MVLGNGDVVQASSTENADLFFGNASSLGMLGTTTQLKIQLVECGKYVEVAYVLVTSYTEALELFANVSPDVDFIDSIMFSSRYSIVVEGHLTHNNNNSSPVV